MGLRRPTVLFLVGWLAIVVPVFAQSSTSPSEVQGAPYFEVATIKPNNPGAHSKEAQVAVISS